MTLFRKPGQPSTHLTLLLITTTLFPGCHRQYYRKQADGEVHSLIAEKAADVARPPNTPIYVDVDRRSRMFNPFDLDFQPMPLDDPNSYRYMQCVDDRRGYPMWEAAGLTNAAENPDWYEFLPLDENGVLVLNMENAVRIALLHSPDYQQQVEQLYLSALAVSAERFVFDTQFFGGANTFLTSDGPRRNGGSNSSTRYSFGPFSNGRRDLTLERRFATGAQLIAGVANNIVWELSGPNTQSASTLLDFSLVQPLLRGAGRDRVLEDLTQSERTLLANIRQFERYRRSFFLQVTVGRNIESTVQLNSAIPNINGRPGFGAGGILGLLQTRQQIRNREENIARQAELLLILEDQLVELLTTIPESADSVIAQRIQVAQTKQQLLSQQQGLISQQVAYQASLDAFLRTLGLPPYICVRIEDPILDQFALIDRTLLTRREELSALRGNVGSINVSILEQAEFKLDTDTGLPISQIQWTPELAQTLQILRSELEPLSDFTDGLINEDVPAVEKDVQELAETIPERRKQAESLLELYRTESENLCGLLNLTEFDESVLEADQLETLISNLNDDFSELKTRLAKYSERINALKAAFDNLDEQSAAALDPRELARRLRDDIILASQDLVAEIGEDVLLLQLIQANARTESIMLPEVDITPEAALEIARNNRRDWANARAALVDSWRAVEVTADDLESTLDVIFSGDVQNVGNNPLALRSTTGQLRVGLQWDAPITRILERNAYRATLIRYEQAKRRFYGFEDSVWQQLRAEIRQLEASRLTFELARRAIVTSAEQIELNTDRRVLREARGQDQGPTAARDSIQATNDLLNAQNGLLGLFVNYEVARRGLNFDMGIMELTPEGLWLDPGDIAPEELLALPGTTSEGMIECGCNDCGLIYHPLPPEPRFGEAMLQVGHTGGPTEVESTIPEAEYEMMPEELEVLPEADMQVEPLPAPDPVPLEPGQHLGVGGI